MKVIVLLAALCAVAYGHQPASLVPVFTKLTKCVEDPSALKSILTDIKRDPNGKEFANNLAAALEKISTEFQEVNDYLSKNGIPYVNMAVKVITKMLTQSNPISDKRAPISISTLPNIINFDCMMETILESLKTDSAVQDLFEELSRPKYSAVFSQIKNSEEIEHFAKSLRSTGVSVSDISNAISGIFNWHDGKSVSENNTPLERFTQTLYSLQNCSNCPSCTACLQCCLLQKYL